MRNNYNSLRLVVFLCVVLFSCQTGLAYSQADFNRNGIVDLDDFSVLAQNWLEVDASKAGFVVAASNASDESKTRADYICDGTADDVEIQAAIYSLPTVGGKVYLTEGTFNTTAKVLLPDNIWLQGSGFSTVINCGTLDDHIIDNNDVSGGNSQITITDLKFDGSSQTNDYSVIHLKNVDHSYISNVYIVGGVEGEHGIYFATVSYSRIDNVTIETVDNDSIRIEQGCSDIVVGNVLSVNPGEDHISIELQDASSNYNRRIVISEVVGHGGRHGFYVDHADNVSISNTALYNISDHGFDVGKTYASEISLSESLFDTNTQANTDLIFVHPGSSHINISNCILKNAQNHGISLEWFGPYDVTITGCKIINSDDGGIRTMGSYVTISNCTVDTTGNGTIPNGIYAGGDHLMISNCYFKDIGNFGIYATGDDISISNCQMRNCYSLGIMCTGNRINISNCTIDTIMDGNSVEEESAITVVNANDVTISNFRFPNDRGDLTLIFDITPRTTGESASAYWMLPTDFSFYLHWNNEGLTWNRNYSGDNGRWRTGNDLGLIGSRNTVVLTHTGTALPRVYINGVFVIALPEILAPTGTADTINNKDMLIGTNTTRTRDWDGVMHGISVYNHVLSVTEIMQLSINPDLPMQQEPIWLMFAPVVGETIVPIIQAHTRRRRAG